MRTRSTSSAPASKTQALNEHKKTTTAPLTRPPTTFAVNTLHGTLEQAIQKTSVIPSPFTTRNTTSAGIGPLKPLPDPNNPPNTLITNYTSPGTIIKDKVVDQPKSFKTFMKTKQHHTPSPVVVGLPSSAPPPPPLSTTPPPPDNVTPPPTKIDKPPGMINRIISLVPDEQYIPDDIDEVMNELDNIIQKKNVKRKLTFSKLPPPPRRLTKLAQEEQEEQERKKQKTIPIDVDNEETQIKHTQYQDIDDMANTQALMEACDSNNDNYKLRFQEEKKPDINEIITITTSFVSWGNEMSRKIKDLAQNARDVTEVMKRNFSNNTVELESIIARTQDLDEQLKKMQNENAQTREYLSALVLQQRRDFSESKLGIKRVMQESITLHHDVAFGKQRQAYEDLVKKLNQF